MKDLNLLNRDLAKVLYLDAKPMAYWLHPDNCLPMEEFRADQTMSSEDLNYLIPELERMKDIPDIQQYLKKKFQIRSILEEAKML